MKWQVMVLLCCGWMSGVALGDTENPQKVEQCGTAVVNTDAGNVMVNEGTEPSPGKCNPISGIGCTGG